MCKNAVQWGGGGVFRRILEMFEKKECLTKYIIVPCCSLSIPNIKTHAVLWENKAACEVDAKPRNREHLAQGRKMNATTAHKFEIDPNV